MRVPRTTFLAAVGLIILAGLAAETACAQNIQGLPRVSPRSTVSQTVGISEISIEYHRPSVNGRTVFPDLVPDEAVWRAGANDNTTITFSDDARVEGREIAAGTYGLHMIPGDDGWTVVFSTNSTSWGSFSYDEAEDALRVRVQAQDGPFTEQLRYQFDHIDNEGAVVSLLWDEVRVPFQVEFDTHALVMAKIRNDLRHLPGFGWQGWNSAAAYCLRSGSDLEQGLEWAERSAGLQENATNLLTRSGLLAALGRADEASEVEARAIAIADEAQINALGYRYLFQQGDPDRAIELFRKNVADHPDSWNTYDSLGEGYAARGDTELATENYSKALSMAPDDQRERIEGILAGLKDEG
jgi:tetratricopeptide (TPR) repeat protein